MQSLFRKVRSIVSPALPPRAVRLTQAERIFSFASSLLILNGLVSVSLVATFTLSHGYTNSLGAWLFLNLLSTSFRLIYQAEIAKRVRNGEDPTWGMQRFAVAAFGGSMIWAFLPAFVPSLHLASSHLYIVIFMFGISAGSVIRGIPYSPLALALGMPPIISVCLQFLMMGELRTTLIALNAVVLMVILWRGCRTAERSFVSTECSKQEATKLAAYLSIANEDIRKTNARLEVIARSDVLTGLANRGRFNELLADAIAAALEDGSEVALLILDLDRFKQVNDTLGHAAGDQMLQQTGQRLRRAVGELGHAARLGGDEFAVVMTGPRLDALSVSVAERFLDLCREPLRLSGNGIAICGSIGVAIWPDHAQTPDELFAAADLALYQAKAKGRNCISIYNMSLKQLMSRKRIIEQDLEAAILKGDVNAWFQPQIGFSGPRIRGFEALVRWTHPRLGAISPPELVDAAHAMNISHLLTGRMAEQACALLCELKERGMDDVSVSINVSPREFGSYSVADLLIEITNRYGIDPSSFEVEFTEETLLDAAQISGELERLEQAGYRLAVDDFGMGHSSLNYLMSLKVDRLKIDRSFTHGIASSEYNQVLVSAMLGVGHLLNLNVVLEGVEDERDERVLRRLGCETAQGYLYARPMPVYMLLEWIGDRMEPELNNTVETHLVA